MDALVDDVIEEIVPTGVDYDEEVYNMPRDEFIAWVRETGNGENVSDIVLEDGSRAISAALRFESLPSEF